MASYTSSMERGHPGIATLQLVSSVPQSSSRGIGPKVLGMLISDKHIKHNVVQNVLREAWARYGPVRIKEVNKSTLMFDFESSQDRDHILELSPWSVHGHCLNLKLCPAKMYVTELDFARLQVWVQVHGLSLEMFNDQNANNIANSIGKGGG